METIGASPKKIAATITALVVPYVIGLLARTFGWELDVGTVTAIVGPVVLAAVVFAAAHLAKPGIVVDNSVVGPASDDVLKASGEKIPTADGRKRK
jgi:hypothetical protein